MEERNVKILINGALGHMGRALQHALESGSWPLTLTGGIDRTVGEYPVPLYANVEATEKADFDVLIDFSVPQGAMEALSLCLLRRKAIVLATTGLSLAQQQRVKEAAASIPVFYTGNMSLGVNLQLALVKQAARILGEAFDAEIIETHHNLKYDAPSGTAKMLIAAVEAGREKEEPLVYGRQETHKRREKGEIGIHSLRGGTVPGEHIVRFFGPDEELTITHRAYSKALFASGALKAAVYMADKAPGLYDMAGLLGL